MSWTCPECSSDNRDSNLRCACGYEFDIYEEERERKFDAMSTEELLHIYDETKFNPESLTIKSILTKRGEGDKLLRFESLPRKGELRREVNEPSRLAYRLAATVLFSDILFLIAEVLFLGFDNLSNNLILTTAIDFFLGMSLILDPTKESFWRFGVFGNVRNFVLFRAIVGSTVGLFFFFPVREIASLSSSEQFSFFLVAFSLINVWSYNGSLILLLTGKSKNWRLRLIMALFAILYFIPYVVILILAATKR